MERKYLIEELEFCLEKWGKDGYCDFGGDRKDCSDCGSPYLTYKMLTGETVDDELSLKEWKEKLEKIKNKN